MLSRRNIRIKVLQALYALSRDEQLSFENALNRYRQNIRKSFELYIYFLGLFVKVTEYAYRDADRRKAKHLPSEEDKRFTPVLHANPLIQSVINHESYKNYFKKYKLGARFNQDLIRKLYQQFAGQEAYRQYFLMQDPSTKNHRDILLLLLKNLMGNELFVEDLNDKFSSWVDDKSLVTGAVKKTLKSLPCQNELVEPYLPSPETTVEFGETLLRSTCHNDEKLLGLIEPILKNWDAERVAVIDMILLKMAVTELTTFSTIPLKVTLNEYVEIAKLYSTDKSKDFINGILDRLMKILAKEGKINKEGRGLID